MLSQTEENYLKAVLKLSPEGQVVSTNDIANELKTKASSVTDMIQKLSDKNLINYKKYHGSTLSRKGKKVALDVLRKHRLWEVFLVEKLNFKWDEIHVIAEQLEHVHSSELINRLDQFLGFPRLDPHGDPIPDSEGNIAAIKEIALSALKTGSMGVIIGVKDSSNDFLQYLDSIGIHLGTKIEILKTFPYDNSMEIKCNGNKVIMVSSVVAKNLSINES